MENIVTNSINLKKASEILVKHFNLHEGNYEIAFEIRVGIGQIGPSEDDKLPGAIVGIAGVSLARLEKPGLHSVDAAKVNPAPKGKPGPKPKPAGKPRPDSDK